MRTRNLLMLEFLALALFTFPGWLPGQVAPAPGVEQEGPEIVQTERIPGYRGIWYSNQPSQDKYRYKYSGGLGTYCAKHRHHAQYVEAVNKTFFVFGGTKGVDEPNALQIMISYFDHETGRVPRPAKIMDKGTSDAHHNPALVVDGDGHLWVFASAHGGKDGFIFRSTEPYSIDAFEKVMQKEFTYPQPQFVEGEGFVFLFSKYTGGREMYVSTSPDGYNWTPDKKIAGFGGHYQISEQLGSKRGTAFNWHPPTGGLNARTQLYYMESSDGGNTWKNVQGEVLQTPLDSPENPALVHDFRANGWLVYMKDITFDENGNPVILVILSRGFESGPENGPRIWTLAHWTGERWRFQEVARSDHNYDMGSLFIEDSGVWRVIAPTDPGPQEYCTGGEMVVWTSDDRGESWKRTATLTKDSPRNHTYARRSLNAHPEFAAFWADGDGLEKSKSLLYFCDRDGSRVWVLPETMEEEYAEPELIQTPAATDYSSTWQMGMGALSRLDLK